MKFIWWKKDIMSLMVMSGLLHIIIKFKNWVGGTLIAKIIKSLKLYHTYF